MKSVWISLLLLLTISTAARTQTVPSSSRSEAGAEAVGASTDVVLPAPVRTSRISIELSGQSSTGDCKVTGTVVAWRTVGGRVDYVLDPASISFTGDCCSVDGMTTAEIFAQVSRTQLEQQILLGLAPCPPSCAAPSIARIYTAACVLRTGSCGTTTFTPCDETQAYREYSYCCENGMAVITELPGAGSNCTAPCGSTTGTGGASLFE